ncbi:MerR family transcriptional regulator [Burkholderia sp. AU42008]|uniref:MerR family transcriptional regulator n=1 Tax=unclassified Burkholderia TaxID=2613784 RepID=UPI000B7AC3CF|nr:MULTISPECIES: MerR family transcriptional regulator [unclassified Burkholderia]MBR8234898.1 MerR family transcriptional regulator [Burkholderia sp. AU32357]MBY4875835.1 MerR family transcriptional regulator [Burkholderia sp. AU42008]OXI39237.1 MerR family transcriptional regulator [Burkholderia sp. AU17457]
MGTDTLRLHASAAAARLGISIKALRLYERHGLVMPERTPAGYRAYGPDDLARAADIAALRKLGLGLAQVANVLDGDARRLDAALAAHETALDRGIRDLVGKLDSVRAMRAGLARGRMPTDGELTRLVDPGSAGVAFDLPWPWGGERFECRDIRPLNYIIGSLGSGKTRLALRLADALPGAVFVGLDRLDDDCAAAFDALRADPELKSRVDRTAALLAGNGATPSAVLTALLVSLEAEGPRVRIVDMIEQGLDQATQRALIAHLRTCAAAGMRPLFLLTRSSAILDLAAVGPDETILLCPANHSPPARVAPYPGAPGYEAVATCLAAPAVRERIARPPEARAMMLGTEREMN